MKQNGALKKDNRKNPNKEDLYEERQPLFKTNRAKSLEGFHLKQGQSKGNQASSTQDIEESDSVRAVEIHDSFLDLMRVCNEGREKELSQGKGKGKQIEIELNGDDEKISMEESVQRAKDRLENGKNWDSTDRIEVSSRFCLLRRSVLCFLPVCHPPLTSR